VSRERINRGGFRCNVRSLGCLRSLFFTSFHFLQLRASICDLNWWQGGLIHSLRGLRTTFQCCALPISTSLRRTFLLDRFAHSEFFVPSSVHKKRPHKAVSFWCPWGECNIGRHSGSACWALGDRQDLKGLGVLAASYGFGSGSGSRGLGARRVQGMTLL